ncbi:hypothetical protein [Roseibacillus ishigakijimensis]|uniref:Uncharacterized protein n=1 Tax=Roseibacillus ishigakijimensis TaxID=454146 RepID=A0A934RK76_9BACT|nr:hypothetical protein [Roseibacillus ishigakijimensis]MBK1833227.1 hypothetical protein [Roseibacillus ishigakijimensis]
MKGTFFGVVGGVFFAGCLCAETYYVNNNTGVPADFRSFQEAHDAASAGDTIILAPSAERYGAITLTKQLIVRGYGFGDAQGAELAENSLITQFSTVKVGSELDDHSASGSVLEGLYATHIYTYSDNCLVSRCRSESVSLNGDNCSVQQSYFFDLSLRRETHGVVSNSFINSSLSVPGDSSLFLSQCTLYRSGSDFDFNAALHENDGDVFVKNSIVGSFRGAGSVTAEYCVILDEENFPFGSHSMLGEADAVFLSEGSWAFKYQTKEGSVAKTASSSGGEVGMFGGNFPYVLRAVPSMPLINSLELISADATTGITFEVKAEGRD